MKFFNFLIETPDEAVERIDDIGGPHSHANYPWAVSYTHLTLPTSDLV